MNIYHFQAASVDHPERCEDALVASAREGKALLAAVIDGMGGHQHKNSDGKLITGRDAAQIVRETLEDDLSNLPADIDAAHGGTAEALLLAALDRAQARIVRDLNSDSTLSMSRRVGAVATVALVCENGASVLIAQIGDTRAYIMHGGLLQQVSDDDDNIGYMIDLGVIDEEDGRRVADIIDTYDGVNEPEPDGMMRIGNTRYDIGLAWRWFVDGSRSLGIPPANAVMNALGIEDGEAYPSLVNVAVTPGDILVLCSDGVYKNLTTNEIAALLDEDDPAEAIGNAALARSKDIRNGRSSPDDIAVVVARLGNA